MVQESIKAGMRDEVVFRNNPNEKPKSEVRRSPSVAEDLRETDLFPSHLLSKSQKESKCVTTRKPRLWLSTMALECAR